MAEVRDFLAEGVGQQVVFPRLAVLGDAGLELAGAGGDDQHATVGLERRELEII